MDPQAQREQAQRVAMDVMRRRRAGEPLTDAAVLAAYPELGDCLADELRKMALVAQARFAAFPTPPPADPNAGTLNRDINSFANEEFEDRADDIRMTTVETGEDADGDIRMTVRSRWKEEDLSATQFLDPEDLEPIDDVTAPQDAGPAAAVFLDPGDELESESDDDAGGDVGHLAELTEAEEAKPDETKIEEAETEDPNAASPSVAADPPRDEPADEVAVSERRDDGPSESPRKADAKTPPPPLHQTLMDDGDPAGATVSLTSLTALDFPPRDDARRDSAADAAVAPPAAQGQTTAKPTESPSRGPASRFRPLARPATPWLRVLDDSQIQGEVIRIRQTSFVLGGRLGDLVVAHDPAIDPVHAEIRYEPERGRWLLRDLNSRTGTFVRVQRLRLRHEDWVILGRTHFQFREDAAHGPHLRILTTTAQTNPQTVPLAGREVHVIGRDAACDINLPDGLLNARHARLARDEQQNRWFLEDLQTINGVWASVRKVPLQGDSIFQIGEQRFIFSLGQ